MNSAAKPEERCSDRNNRTVTQSAEPLVVLIQLTAPLAGSRFGWSGRCFRIGIPPIHQYDREVEDRVS